MYFIDKINTVGGDGRLSNVLQKTARNRRYKIQIIRFVHFVFQILNQQIFDLCDKFVCRFYYVYLTKSSHIVGCWWYKINSRHILNWIAVRTQQSISYFQLLYSKHKNKTINQYLQMSCHAEISQLFDIQQGRYYVLAKVVIDQHFPWGFAEIRVDQWLLIKVDHTLQNLFRRIKCRICQ